MRRLAFLDYGTKVVDTITGYCGITLKVSTVQGDLVEIGLMQKG